MNNQTSSLEFSHFPVMLNEVLKISSPSNRKKFIDCTFGGGGYSKEILKFLKTKVLAIDRDKKVLMSQSWIHEHTNFITGISAFSSDVK